MIEYRWADNQLDRLSALANELVRQRVSVIVIFRSAPRPAASLALRPAGIALPPTVREAAAS